MLRALADWMKTLADNTIGSSTTDPVESTAAAYAHNGAAREATVAGAGILQDPRAGPLLNVLRSQALRIIGEVCSTICNCISPPCGTCLLLCSAAASRGASPLPACLHGSPVATKVNAFRRTTSSQKVSRATLEHT